MYTVKLRYNGLLGGFLKDPLYLKSIISKLGYGWLTICVCATYDQIFLYMYVHDY